MELATPIDGLRLACGLFFLPHIFDKLRRLPLDFFKKVGFPAALWVMYGAAIVEILICIGLVFAIWTSLAAWLGVIYMIIAAMALIKVRPQHPWIWYFGGIEYTVFWAIACGLVAVSYQ